MRLRWQLPQLLLKNQSNRSVEAVKKSCNPMMSPQTLTDVVKQVAKEKYQSRNLIVFGLEEDEEEILSEKINDLLKTMGGRPKTEAYR